MGLILLVLACAVLVGRLRGGRLARLGDGPVRGWRLLAVGLLVEVLALGTDSVVGPGLPAKAVNESALVMCGVLAGVFWVANRRVPGVSLVGLGLLCNVLVVGLNGMMPVSRHALRRAGASVSAFDQVPHAPADHRTVLRVLGDIVPVPLPAHPEVDSVGDLAIAAGMAQFVLTGMLHPARGPGRSPGQAWGFRTDPDSTGSVRRRRAPGGAAVGAAARLRRERRGVVNADSELVRVITEPSDDVRPDPIDPTDPTDRLT